MTVRLASAMWVCFATPLGCLADLDESAFRRRAEAAYGEAHPGFTIHRREEGRTLFVRADQVDELDVEALWTEYQASGQSSHVFFREWVQAEKREAERRKRTLSQAASDLIPVLKSGRWVRAQDLGAIGPERTRKRIRPWRRAVTDGLYVVLGVPEEGVGVRYASIHEVESSTVAEGDWLDRAVANMENDLTLADQGEEVRDEDGVFLVCELPHEPHVSSLLLSPAFRRRLLERTGLPSLGVAAPIRSVLILFNPNRFTAMKPVRARAHQLYDTQNPPTFRGLLRLDTDSIHILEPPYPKGT
ncbi:MAG: hypothetical protein ACFB9M_03230 [Myxococcota bacterium]